MGKYGGNVKVCVTCNYYGGQRVAEFSGGASEAPNGSRGSCNYPQKRGTQTNEAASCQFWQKWPSLR